MFIGVMIKVFLYYEGVLKCINIMVCGAEQCDPLLFQGVLHLCGWINVHYYSCSTKEMFLYDFLVILKKLKLHDFSSNSEANASESPQEMFPHYVQKVVDHDQRTVCIFSSILQVRKGLRYTPVCGRDF